MRGEVEALLRLKQIEGLGDRGIASLVKVRGSGVEALRALKAQEELWKGGKAPVHPVGWQDRAIRALPMTSPEYPGALLELSDPPPLLFLKGRDALLEGPAVAVVGARKATEGGRRVAEGLGRVLAREGITVVSGLAMGIDGAAHRGALSVDGNTLAVLGSGLEVVYPPAHRKLFRDIGRRGLLLSEFLPEEAPLPHHFPKRNRIIAALAEAIVVVEAGERSGALITVDHGLDLGREILAVPGSVHNPSSRGTNALIRDGARLLPSPEAILQELPHLGSGDHGVGSGANGGEGGGQAPSDTRTSRDRELPADLRRIWGGLGLDPRTADRIASSAGMTLSETLAGLSSLEILGWVRRCPGMRFCRG